MEPSSLTVHREVAKWLLRDGLLGHKRSVLVVGSCMLAGVALQGSVLGVMLQYGRALEGGQSANVLGSSVDPRTNVQLVWILGAIAGAGLVSSAVLLYLGRVQAVRSSVAYERELVGRVLSLVAAGPGSDGYGWPRDATSAAQLVSRGPRIAGRAQRMCLLAIHPLVTALSALAGLIYLSPYLSLVVLSLLAASGFVVLRINQSGAATTNRLRLVSPAANALRKSIMQGGWAAGIRYGPKQIASSLGSSQFDNFLKAYEKRLTIVDAGWLAGAISAGVVMTAVIVIEGTFLVGRGGGWSDLIVYFVVLRAFLGAVQRLVRMSTSLSRHFSTILAMSEFLSREGGTHSHAQRARSLRSGTLRITTARNDVVRDPAPGEDVACISASGADMGLIVRLLPVLEVVEAERTRPPAIVLAAADLTPVLPCSLGEAFGVVTEDTAEFLAIYERIAGPKSAWLSESGVHERLPPAAWADLPSESRRELALAAALVHRADVLVYQADQFPQISRFSAWAPWAIAVRKPQTLSDIGPNDPVLVDDGSEVRHFTMASALSEADLKSITSARRTQDFADEEELDEFD